MENATKALLIAAAVLIVILLIALGMRIFNSTSDVSGQASQVGEKIETEGKRATDSASDAIGDSTMAFKSEGEKLNYMVGKYLKEDNTSEEILSLLNYLHIDPDDAVDIHWRPYYTSLWNGETALTEKWVEDNYKYSVTASYNNEGVVNSIWIVQNK